MPTLKTIGSAPVTSPLTGVDLEDVGMFLVQLTNRDFLQSKPENIDELDNCHDTIAYALCNQIIAEPLSFHVKLHTKLLGNLRISIDDFTRLKEIKALYQQMIEAVKDKGYLKSLEKFGQKLDLYLEQNPNKDEVQEAPTKDEEGVAESEVPQDNSNNATKMFRKRALFSQTCNTMMQDDAADPRTPTEKNRTSTIKELVDKNNDDKPVTESDDDDLFATPNATPNRVTKLHATVGEIEITRIEESPLDGGSEEIVSGNIKEMRVNKLDMADSEDDEDSDDAGPTTSTQIERRSSKRLLISSTTTSTEDEDEPVRGKRNSKGGKVPKSVEPSKPHRKSRRLDSSTDTATGSSSEASEGSKATTKKRSRK